MGNRTSNTLEHSHKKNLFIIFGITTIYFCIWYSFLMPIVRCIVSSDEFLSIATGVTGFSDIDWNILVGKVQRYYGNGYTFLFTPLLYLIESSYWRYFVMHVANSILHGMVGIICYKIYTVYLHRHDDIQAVVVSLTTSLFYFEGLEGTNIYNELPLYLTVWLVLIELLWLFNLENDPKKKAAGTFVLCATLVYSMFLHTRAIFTIGAICLTIVFIYIIYRKIIVNIFVFIGTLGSGCFFSEVLNKLIRVNLWNEEITQNTVEGAFGTGGVFSKFDILFSAEGLRGFWGVILGRLFGIFTTSGGLLCLGVIVLFFAIYKVGKEHIILEKEEVSNFRVAMIFLGTILVASFFMFGLNAAESVAMALEREEISYWPFYLRYHMLYFIPLFPFIYAGLDIYVRQSRKILFATLVCFGITKALTLSILMPLFVNESIRYRHKIVYYAFMPFTLKTGTELIGKEMLFANFLVSILLFLCHIILLFKRKIKCSCILSILTSVYLFAYVMLAVFIPESKAIYNKTDQIYEYMRNISQEEVDTDVIYYVGFTHLEAEVLQFGLFEWKLSDEYIEMENNNCIIVSNRMLQKDELSQYEQENIFYKRLDTEEYIYFIGIDIDEGKK